MSNHGGFAAAREEVDDGSDNRNSKARVWNDIFSRLDDVTDRNRLHDGKDHA